MLVVFGASVCVFVHRFTSVVGGDVTFCVVNDEVHWLSVSNQLHASVGYHRFILSLVRRFEDMVVFKVAVQTNNSADFFHAFFHVFETIDVIGNTHTILVTEVPGRRTNAENVSVL